LGLNPSLTVPTLEPTTTTHAKDSLESKEDTQCRQWVDHRTGSWKKNALHTLHRTPSQNILAIIASLILLILAVVIPIYFFVVRPNSQKSAAEEAQESAAKPSGTGKGGKPPVVALVSGGDGSKVTTEDGSTFTYSNSFGGVWYWDENDPFNNGAKAQSWSPALNETFNYGVDKIRG
jgi:glucan 1,3-beta-glucosidase